LFHPLFLTAVVMVVSNTIMRFWPWGWACWLCIEIVGIGLATTLHIMWLACDGDAYDILFDFWCYCLCNGCHKML